MFFDDSPLVMVMKIIDPIYAISGGTDLHAVTETFTDPMTGEVYTSETYDYAYFATDTIICTIVNNLVYAGLFFGLGALIFSKRDVK